MAISAKYMLRKARNEADMSRREASCALFITEDALKRMEDPASTSMPSSLDVSRMETVYKAKNLWHRWMQATDEVYRDHYPYSIPDYPLLQAVVNARHQQTDVAALYDSLERDAMDGHVDNPQLREEMIREAREARDALDEMISRLVEERR